jgi:hypothetical protein
VTVVKKSKELCSDDEDEFDASRAKKKNSGPQVTVKKSKW